MTPPTQPPTDAGDEQQRYYDRYLADEIAASKSSTGGSPDGGDRKKWIIGAAAALAAVVAVAGALALGGGGDDKGASAQQSSSSGSPTSPSSSSVAHGSGGPATQSSSSSPTSSTRTFSPLEDGWQAVGGDADRPVIYDVPQSWKVEGPNRLVGYDKDFPDESAVMGKVAATAGGGYCRSNREASRAFITVVTAGVRDPGEAGPDILSDAANIVSKDKDGKGNAEVTTGKARTVKLYDQVTPAVLATATVNVGKGKANTDCNPAKADMRTLTFSYRDKTTSILFVRDEAGAQGIPSNEIDKIIKTVRPLPQ